MSDNFFIVRDFDWRVRRAYLFDRIVNKLMRLLGIERSIDSSDSLERLCLRLTGRPFLSIDSGVMTNVEQRMNIYHLVSQVLAYKVEGDLVELGCHEGRTAVLIGKVMAEHDASKRLHLFDSFAGLPTPSGFDGTLFKEGLLATPEAIVIDNFRAFDLPLPAIHPGWFQDTLAEGLPEKICFAHLDGDLYDSILVSLQHVYPRLTKGAICLVDDYCDPSIHPEGWNHAPGVKKACDEFLADKPERVEFLYSGHYSHGFFRKE
jgi:O-methyltransferase